MVYIDREIPLRPSDKCLMVEYLPHASVPVQYSIVVLCCISHKFGDSAYYCLQMGQTAWQPGTWLNGDSLRINEFCLWTLLKSREKGDSPMPRRPISSSVHRPFRTGKRQRHQVIYSLVLVLFIFAGLLANLATAIPASLPMNATARIPLLLVPGMAGRCPSAQSLPNSMVVALPLLVSGTSSVGWMALVIA